MFGRIQYSLLGFKYISYIHTDVPKKLHSTKIKKNITEVQIKAQKKQKKVISFDDHIKAIITKLLEKHKIDLQNPYTTVLFFD